MRYLVCAIALLGLSASGWAYDSAGAETFQSATAAFSSGDYQAAQAGFRDCLAEVGDDPTIHYNIAVACLRIEQPGLALAHLLSARKLAPRDAEIRRQLRVVWSELDQSEPPPASWLHAIWDGLRDGLTYTEALWSAALVIACASALIGLWLLTGRRRFQWPGIIALMLAAVAVSLAGAKIAQRIGLPHAILTQGDVALRGGPGEEFGEIERLAEGADVTLLERPRLHIGAGLSISAELDEQGLWAEVRTPTGARGYVRRGLLAMY